MERMLFVGLGCRYTRCAPVKGIVQAQEYGVCGLREVKPDAPPVDRVCQKVLHAVVWRNAKTESLRPYWDGVLSGGMVSRSTGGVKMTVSGQIISMTESINKSESEGTQRPSNGNHGPFTLSGRVHSFRHAAYGLSLMVKSQHNAWLHVFASVCVLVVGGLFRLSDGEWCWIILAIMAVWTAEALNTALEFLADAASPEFHPLVKNAKDVAAGGVLISAIGSVVIGLLVLGPHLLHFLGRIF